MKSWPTRPSAATILPATFAASTPPAGVENEFVASMFRLVANSNTGAPAFPTMRTLAACGSHAAFGSGYRSTRYVSRSAGVAADCSTYPAAASRAATCAMLESNPGLPGQRTNRSR